ncbi:MAG: MFS transporter [Candidatus Acidiferrales bacterium]
MASRLVGTRLFAPQTGMLRALRLRDYRLFWTGNFLSNIGTWMHQVALGWLVLEMTNSPFLLGLVGFAQFIPALLFSLPGGVIADRVNRRKWLLATHSAMLLLALTLALTVSFKAIDFPLVATIAFLLGTTSAVNFPAFQAMVRDLSSREDLLNAIALNSMQFNASRFIGPAIAGLLVGTVGLAICFYINAASYLAPLVALWMVHHRAEARAGNPPWRAGLQEGFDYLRGHPRIFLLVGFVGMISLFGLPYLIFLPIFARDVLHVGATGLGYLFSASGGGALAGAMVLAGWRSEWRRVPLVLGGMLFFFGGVLTLALSTSFTLSLAALVIVGAAMVAAVGTINSLLQTVVPDEVRGRVLGWHSMAYLGFSPVGSLLIGALADVWNTPAALALSAALPLAVTVLLIIRLPWLRQLQ